MRLQSSFILLISIITIVSSSCHKEAKFDVTTDTLKIARVFQPDATLGKDAVIESILPDQNFGSESFFTVFSWTNGGAFNNSRALIAFDLSEIPTQTTIKSAKLILYWNAFENLTEHTGENGFTIYKINQSWSENSVTWNNQPSITNQDSIVVAKSVSFDQSYFIDVTGLVQKMIKTPSENFGFMLHLNQEFPYRLVILASSDCSDFTKHPKLVVYF